jgi:GATA-binding protein
MENLTWRMMALALKKKKEDEEAKSVAPAEETKAPGVKTTEGLDSGSRLPPQEAGREGNGNERGRRIDKGKTKVRVVGFDGMNQDGTEEDEE